MTTRPHIVFMRVPTWVHWFARMIVDLQDGFPFNHCGLLVERDNKLYVFQIVPYLNVIVLPFWLVDLLFDVKVMAYKQEVLVKDVDDRIKAFAQAKYDFGFYQGNDKLYCSELVAEVIGFLGFTRLKELKNLEKWWHKIKELRRGKDIDFDQSVVTLLDLYEACTPID